ncbi:MAG: hypothetical protein ACK54H_06165 [Phycisphaerales bacterium]
MRQTSVLVCVCGLTLSAGLAQAQLNNPSFEVPGTSTVFDGWTTFDNALPEFAGARTGVVCLKAYGNFSAPYNAAGAYQDVAVTPGQSYEAKVWMFNSAADPIQGSNFGAINIEWLDASGTQISFESTTGATAATVRDVWREYSVTSYAPPGAVTARVVTIHIQGPELLGGSVLFDDASFAAVNLNGLANGGFESNFVNWTKFNNAFIDSTFVRTGTKSVKMFGCWCGPYNATGCFQDTPATAGEAFEATAYVGTKGADRISGDNFAVLNIEFRDAGNNLISYVSAPAADANTAPDVWHPVTVSGVAPAGTVKARVVPLHIQPATAGGAVWFDDITFGPAQPTGCPADWTNDGGVDGDDVIAFFTDWDAGNADYTGDGGTDGDDVIAFFADWDAGC